jgi:hypothetical protein
LGKIQTHTHDITTTFWHIKTSTAKQKRKARFRLQFFDFQICTDFVEIKNKFRKKYKWHKRNTFELNEKNVKKFRKFFISMKIAKYKEFIAVQK